MKRPIATTHCCGARVHRARMLLFAVLIGQFVVDSPAWADLAYAESPFFELSTVWRSVGLDESSLFSLNTIWLDAGCGESVPFELSTVWSNVSAGESALFVLMTTWDGAAFGESVTFALNTVWISWGFGESPLFALSTLWTCIGYGESPLFVLYTFAAPEAPEQLVIFWLSDGAHLHWRPVDEADVRYAVFSDSSVLGSFDELLATTADTMFVDSAAAVSSDPLMFYVVRATRQQERASARQLDKSKGLDFPAAKHTQ